MKRTKFSQEEDMILIQMVKEYGEYNWQEISTKMKKTERQCKDRFLSYLSPKINKNECTSEEDIKLVQKIEEVGNKWILISKFLDRTDVQCKNRARKLQRQQRKYLRLLKETEFMNQKESQDIINEEKIQFLEGSDIWEDFQWNFE
jgi:hypothetical protein